MRAVEDNGRLLYLEFGNGRFATVYRDYPFEIDVGSVVLVSDEEDYVEVAPDELWPEESWVGVVHLVHFLMMR